ncbi:MAG: InlB B-repeat-containing protein, partial [Candidatus Methanomethylophilaceae archaeon]|nr:InlB B-repeat-containing protein [Candidatus Methanomethylophilaceae archaeon]
LIATIALILALAVGIGFAYAAYTANNGNNTEVAYVTLTQVGDPTPYTFADNTTVKLDTYNRENQGVIETFYRLSGFNTVKGSDPNYGTYKCGLLGTIELHADFTGTNVTPPQTLDISISGSSGFDATATWKYFITDAPDPSTGMTSKIYAMKDSAKAVSEWTQGMDSLTMTHGQSGYQNVKLYVYYGYAADAETLVDGMMFLNSTEAPKKLVNASLMIKATSDSDSYLVTYKANNGTAEKDFMVSAAANASYTLVTDPKKIGFTVPANKQFKGWSLSATGDIISTPTITVNGDKILYAIWQDA